ncbi:MFS general substrate transporter [Violaceomyces palustris]|uniref:MFS general substrate transporter n=1 Tax=Violaceomyces palustris TaxID=1673888 RepID=A0ACD0NND8_9BASI|nr:MFS general substrate transporter [Violaceomyces palustris]
MKRSEWVAVMGSLWITLFMAGLDGTIVMTLIQSIASSFQAAEKSSWLGTSYLLSVCAFSPVYGRLSDIIGRKGALLVALFFFTVGNGACGLASTMESLLVARFVSGIGGGGLLTCASIVMTDMIPIRQRGLWQGITNVLFGTAAGLGGPVGGWINDSYGWRQAFLFQVPFLLVGGICIALFVNIPMASNEQSLSEKLRRIDFLGSLTLVSGTTCLLLAMSFLSSDDVPFSDPKVWGLLLVSLLFGLAFIYVEARVVKEPIMPLRLLTDRSSASVCASFFVLSFTYYSFLFHFPLWFQSVRLQSAGQAGLHLLPLATTGALGSLIAGVYMKSTGKYWSFNMISSILIVLSSFYVALWDDSTSQIGEYLGLTPNGFGVSAVYTFNLSECKSLQGLRPLRRRNTKHSLNP